MPPVEIEKFLRFLLVPELPSDFSLNPKNDVDFPSCIQDSVTSIGVEQPVVEESTTVAYLEDEGQHKQDQVVNDRPEVHHDFDRLHLIVFEVAHDFRVILEREGLVLRMHK